MATEEISKTLKESIDAAADLLVEADSILFTSGAGLGVGSGLGTFRGIGAGVWPPLEKHPDLDFTHMSNPSWFHKKQGNSVEHNTANFGYAFWAFRYESYTSAAPHQGYEIAKKWASMKNIQSSFSFTSNIDGHWIRSGWDKSKVLECHGSIEYMQCVKNCSQKIWPTDGALKLKVDPETDCAIDALPLCPDCKGLARANVLMFGDWEFYDARHKEQDLCYEKFVEDIAERKSKLLIIELGAGTAVPTVRFESESMFLDKRWTASFIRINPSSSHAKVSGECKSTPEKKIIELNMDALTALQLIDQALQNKTRI